MVCIVTDTILVTDYTITCPEFSVIEPTFRGSHKRLGREAPAATNRPEGSPFVDHEFGRAVTPDRSGQIILIIIIIVCPGHIRFHTYLVQRPTGRRHIRDIIIMAGKITRRDITGNKLIGRTPIKLILVQVIVLMPGQHVDVMTVHILVIGQQLLRVDNPLGIFLDTDATDAISQSAFTVHVFHQAIGVLIHREIDCQLEILQEGNIGIYPGGPQVHLRLVLVLINLEEDIPP